MRLWVAPAIVTTFVVLIGVVLPYLLDRDNMRKDPSVSYMRLSVPHLKPAACAIQTVNYPGVSYGDGMIWRVMDQHPEDLVITMRVSSDETVTIFGCNRSETGASIAPRDLEVRFRIGQHGRGKP